MGQVDQVGEGISLLVPMHLVDADWTVDIRAKTWHWLEQYWRLNLPGAEIVIGDDADAGILPFSKSAAVNDAADKALGDILVVIDADAYLPVESILRCAREIRLARDEGHKLWFLPYRQLYRLTQNISNKVLESDPAHPLKITEPPPEEDYINKETFSGVKGVHSATPVSRIGHWYGAMCQIAPSEGFEDVGGWDPRFRGWGGEDHAAMRAMDTLFAPHKTLPEAIMHLWHPIINALSTFTSDKKRVWANQPVTATNDALSGRYYYSNRDAKKMRGLVDEFKEYRHHHHHHHHRNSY